MADLQHAAKQFCSWFVYFLLTSVMNYIALMFVKFVMVQGKIRRNRLQTKDMYNIAYSLLEQITTLQNYMIQFPFAKSSRTIPLHDNSLAQNSRLFLRTFLYSSSLFAFCQPMPYCTNQTSHHCMWNLIKTNIASVYHVEIDNVKMVQLR